MLADLTIKDFLAETAGSGPVPGGGRIFACDRFHLSFHFRIFLFANSQMGHHLCQSCRYSAIQGRYTSTTLMEPQLWDVPPRLEVSAWENVRT